ncbi:MAG: SDR family oxidoreductase [Chloroflexi bacterium]|nr:SDR family oxidoreductase [Chloroflexota bacterium]MBM3175685.1 SDR family oxidoreductase [Chloroflexota bacterium]MBM4450339.1 SDR family oxidoreductase [Chloroflexota bacterium]MBM4453369.1 SDR family oxidoreductase [Chloroflexota bacterium]
MGDMEKQRAKLAGKVAIVTGSSRGIGKAIALEMARAGAEVVVAARTEAERQSKLPGTIHATVEEIRAFGGEAMPVRLDITREDDVDAMVSTVTDKYGKVDILVNNAGITTPESFMDLTVKKWDLIMAVNLRGVFLCTKAVLPGMIERQSGSIINISSAAGNVLIKGSIAYGVTKAGLERFTLGLAKEMRKHNIAVNALRLDLTVTEAVRTFLPGVDTSGWQTAEMWGKYAVLLAAHDPSLTGQVLNEQACREIFGTV